jgi:hypothetical protein
MFFEHWQNREYAAGRKGKMPVMDPRAKLSELILALEMPMEEFRTYFDRKTATLVSVEETMLSQLEDGEEADPDDLAEWRKDEYEAAREIVSDDGSRFIPPPEKFDFDEYHVMEHYIRSIDHDDAANQLWLAIKGRGAFSRFKDTLHRLGIQQSWYDYLEEARKKFVIEWAEENNVAFEDDLNKSRK